MIISLMPSPPDHKTVQYTWFGATPEEKAATRASWNSVGVILSLIVIVVFYLKFW